MVRKTKKKPAARTTPTDVAERRRRDLLDAAYSLIGEHGMEGLRTRDIAARAGVNIATLHYYFGTKEALVLAVLNHTRQILIGAATSPLVERGSWSPSLEDELVGTWGAFQKSPNLAIVLQELALVAQRDATTRADFRTAHRGWNAHVESVITAGIQDGTLHEGIDAKLGARIITSFTMGAMTQLGIDPGAFDFAKASAEIVRWLGQMPRAPSRRRRD